MRERRMHAKCHIIRKACELFYRMLEKNLRTGIGRNFYLYWSKFPPSFVNFLTFIGRNLYLSWPTFSTIIGRNFYLYWSKFWPLLVENSIFLGQNCAMAMGIFRPTRWSNFRPKKFRPMRWLTLVEIWSKNGSKFRPILVEKWPQM